MFRLFVPICAAGSVCLVPTPVMATDDALKIAVNATIAERCGITADDSVSTPGTANLDVATTLKFGFTLDCNTPFVIGVSSANGALLMQDSGDGFATAKDYAVALDVETDGTRLTTGACAASALTNTAGRCPFFGTSPGEGIRSGRRTAIGRRGSVIVSWPGGEGPVRRAAGLYQDVLIVVVGVKS
jgi:hypothetical protein